VIRYAGEAFEAPDDHPVFGVSLADARAYCRWAGLRLPDTDEWFLAAVGPEGRRWPRGDDAPRPDADNVGRWVEGYPGDVRDRRDGFPYTAPVRSFAEAASPFGCLQMSGNVSEWVERTTSISVRIEGHERAVTQRGKAEGGSWNYAPPASPGESGWTGAPDSRWPYLGFRVAGSP